MKRPGVQGLWCPDSIVHPIDHYTVMIDNEPTDEVIHSSIAESMDIFMMNLYIFASVREWWHIMLLRRRAYCPLAPGKGAGHPELPRPLEGEKSVGTGGKQSL